MTEARLVVFAVGNEARGDDALGPLLLRRLEAEAPSGVRLVPDFQLQLEHALDLQDADIALFIDAADGLEAPFILHEVFPGADTPAFSHALSPAGVLAVFARVEQAAPPPAFVLAVRGRNFGLGEDMSELARQDAEAAWSLLLQLLQERGAERWRALATPGAAA